MPFLILIPIPWLVAGGDEEWLSLKIASPLEIEADGSDMDRKAILPRRAIDKNERRNMIDGNFSAPEAL
jgi:hypothetical protein